MTKRPKAQKLKVGQNNQKLLKETETRSKVISLPTTNKKVSNQKFTKVFLKCFKSLKTSSKTTNTAKQHKNKWSKTAECTENHLKKFLRQ